MRTSRGRIDQCTAVQGRGGSTGEQDLRVQGCLSFSVKQVSCRGGKSHKERDRGGVGGCLSLKESCGVKCAGAVSAVFRGRVYSVNCGAGSTAGAGDWLLQRSEGAA